MECSCKNGKFWMGLGLGAVLGMVACHCARSEKAKLLKEKMSCAARQAADKAGEWMAGVKECQKEKEV